MHGPWRANLERSNQSAHKQSAQPEETPPRWAGKWAKAYLRAISVATYVSEWTSRPASFSKKLDDRGKQTSALLPGTAHIIHEEVFIASLNPPFLHTAAGIYSIAEVGSVCSPHQTCFQSEQSHCRSFSRRAISSL